MPSSQKFYPMFATSLHIFLSRFQAKGMDIGVADESLNGIPYEESSESEEEEEAEETEGEDRQTFNSNRDFRVFLRIPLCPCFHDHGNQLSSFSFLSLWSEASTVSKLRQLLTFLDSNSSISDFLDCSRHSSFFSTHYAFIFLAFTIFDTQVEYKVVVGRNDDS